MTATDPTSAPAERSVSDRSEVVHATALTLAHGSHVAVAEATFSCGAGTLTAVVGPNGSGKSTLFDALCGLMAPVSGQVRVLGRAPRAARRRVAYVLQGATVNEHLPVTVGEVVSMGRYPGSRVLRRLRRSDRDAIDRALERMEVADLRRRHLGELSGGQRQRVFVAQGLAQEGDVLVLDEPVTGLDLLSRELILHAVDEEVAAGRTVLASTHNLGEAARADQVLLLATRLVAAGPPEEVLSARHLRDAYGARLIHLEEGTALLDDPHHHAEGDDHTDHLHL